MSARRFVDVVETIEVEHHRWETFESEDGRERGGRSVVDHVSTERVRITIDLTTLARVLGAIAVRSKGGKSKEASGLVVVEHIRPKTAKKRRAVKP